MRVDRQLRKANQRLVRNLLMVVVAMFGFGFALVPLYNVFCTVTGLNGKTGRIAAAEAQQSRVDKQRVVTIQFVANTNEDLPWEFAPLVHKLQVHPGEINQITYYAKNLSDHAIVGQAVPSLAPGVAAKYLNKTECFCFTRQTLAPHEIREMPVRFIIDPELPRDIATVTLSYTFFDTNQIGVRNLSGGADTTPASQGSGPTKAD